MGTKLEDSNIAGYGSKDHKDLKLAAAQSEKAWAGAGKVVGVQIWRIEKFQVVPWPKDQYGKFFRGDSYIVLYTYKPNPDSDKLAYNVHFWLGSKTSQDEQGTAAYKTVELDDLLGDLPVQYRETEGNESENFLEVFKNKITLMDGGIDSGFNTVKPTEYKPRLFHLKGKKEIRVAQVDLSWKELNVGDVFILDCGLTIYQWNGKTAGIFEKRKAQEITKAYQDERNGKPKIQILDMCEDQPDFWKVLGGKPTEGELKPATPDDVKIEHKKVLLHLSDASGTLKMDTVQEGKLSKSKLNHDDVFIVDIGHTIYCWIGSKASKQERAQGINRATEYLKSKGGAMTTPVLRVIGGSEPPSFHKSFDD